MYGYILVGFISICLIINYAFLYTHFIGTIIGDGVGYYAYLPSTFIWHDWSMGFALPHWTYCISDIGKVVLKYPMGVSLLISPFFAVVHFFVKILNYFDKTGYSLPYHIAVSISTLFYYILGSIFCYKTIIKKFSKNIALSAICAVTLGCGMIFYIVYHTSYSHIYSFCLISIFIYLVIQEEKNKNKKWFYPVMGLTLGLIFLIRNINILIIIFWLFYGVDSLNSAKIRLKEFILNRKLIFSLVGFLLVLIPQVVYWKIQTGHFIVNTYAFKDMICIKAQNCKKEYFDFLTPHFINNFFSLRKGLFVYYPVMMFTIFGLFKLRKYYSEIYFSIVLFLAPAIYLICAWHEWWYGFSFGQRVYIDYMALFAILIATALKFLYEKLNDKKRIFFKLSVVIFILFIALSLFFMYLLLNHHGNMEGSLTLF